MELEIVKLHPGDSLLVRAGRLFSGKEDCFRVNVFLFIRGGVIERIFAAPGGEKLKKALKNLGKEEQKEQIPFLDLSRLTILPGLVDCHVHLALDGEDFQKAARSWTAPEEMKKHLARRLANTLARGVLAVRDGGDRAGIGFLAKEMIKSGTLFSPHITITGSALRKSGMYGSFLGAGVNKGELAGSLKRLIAAGVDQIKVLVSGIVSFREYGRVGPLQFGPEELNILVAEAHRAGLKVMAHANSDQAVTMAARAGVDSIEHGYFIGRSTLAMLAELDISWVPTVVPVASQVRRSDLFSQEQLRVIEKTYKKQLEAIGEAAVLGVRLGVGTDAGAPGVPHGEGYLEELALYRQAGLKPAFILRAATAGGAKIAGAAQKVGLLEEGRPASLIAVEGNPLADLNALKKIKYCFLS